MVDLAAACRPGASLTQLSPSTYQLPGGLEVVLVSRREQLGPALARLRGEADAHAATFVQLTLPPREVRTATVAIDLEWRPDFRPGENNAVALVQLAAGGLCVLVRTCLLGLPAELRSFMG